MTETWEIRVRGLVQGVGFRPTVWRIASASGFCGDVLNDAEGVLIRLAAPRSAAEAFLDDLRANAPPLSRIDRTELTRFSGSKTWRGFQIVNSKAGNVTTGIVPDAATCADCLAEILDPSNRRYGYAFTNCTNCGPRLSIIKAIPYDRANTAMAAFKMCTSCQREYDDPSNRRFHAQPNACPDCGPRLWIEDGNGHAVEGEPIETASSLLKAGKIIAIKGLGGFQLACDAKNADAVATLRRRKKRAAKPFALMGRNPEMIARFVDLDPVALSALTSPRAPIVLAPIAREPLVSQIAPGQNRLGFMLPNSPLHHLLLHQFNGPIVLTSGNLSNEPQVTGNTQAKERLKALADYWLLHDRDIVNRLDDSVLQTLDNSQQNLRRARGYAPAPLQLHKDFAGSAPVLAMGADLKNTFCLLANGQATLSQHIGDLANPGTHADYRKNLAFYQNIHEFTPGVIAVDMHPGYFSTRYGQDKAAQADIPAIPIQHHHAHIAAVLGEYGHGPNCAPVLGITLDGIGYGEDGSLWGGEILCADFHGYKRLAHFKPVALPGGDKANTQPWRNTLAHLLSAFGADALTVLAQRHGPLPVLQALEKKPSTMVAQTIRQGVNAPESSSAGRLFDAVAGALNLCFDEIQFEGQAAMLLQVLAESASLERGDYGVIPDDVINWQPLWQGILTDQQANVSPAIIAARFHNSLIRVIAAVAIRNARQQKVQTIALSGGVLQNVRLNSGLRQSLETKGFTVIAPRSFPTNDGGIALGQALIAAARAKADL